MNNHNRLPVKRVYRRYFQDSAFSTKDPLKFRDQIILTELLSTSLLEKSSLHRTSRIFTD